MNIPRIFPLMTLAVGLSVPGISSAVSEPDPAEIQATLYKAADWYLEHPVQWVGLTAWHMAPFYDGLLALGETTGEAGYIAALIDYGERVAWAPGGRIYHADDHAVGHAWVDMYAMNPERPDRLELIKERMDHVVENPVKRSERWPRFRNYDRMHWWWCDALYMAPPTLAKLSKVTGDHKYLRFMDYEFRRTYDELYDKEEALFYRDGDFFDTRTPTGKKVFWSRGNGWVYGGLVLVMDELPETDLSFSFYKKLYMEMTEAIVRLQDDEGLWWPSLLDESHVSSKETSGSAFFVYGLAWGINRGYLDRETYLPAAIKGWNALADCVHPDGKLGFVQPVGASPEDNISYESTQAYGVGAFLMAGSEILKMLGQRSDKSVETLYAEAEERYAKASMNRLTAAYYVPERADDLAWENDKVAFRLYGPALRESTEDSGIDIWQKRVSYPIIQKWYQKEFDGTGSYHKDTGEGYDTYKVGASRGCGGTGIWYKGKLYTANTYRDYGIRSTPAGLAGFMVQYIYEIEDERIFERKHVILKEGAYVSEGKSMFFGPDEILRNSKIAIGLVAQSPDAKVISEDGVLTMWDKVDGYWLATGVKVLGAPSEAITIPAETPLGDTLLLVDMDQYNRAIYAFGYTWERHTDIKSHDAWRDYLSDYPVTIGPMQLEGRTDPELFRLFRMRRR